jgi:hypothetical protein
MWHGADEGRGMKRYLFNVLAVVSLLISVATCAAWLLRPIDLLQSSHFGHWIHLGIRPDGYGNLTVYSHEPHRGDSFRGYTVREWGGIGWYRVSGINPPNAGTNIVLPVGYALAMCAALPLCWLAIALTRKKKSAGFAVIQATSESAKLK